MKLTKEQIDEIVRACGGGMRLELIRARLTRAFGERVNPWYGWIGEPGLNGRIPALFDAAAKVADGCDAEGYRDVDDDEAIAACAALKRIVEEIRGMA